IKMHHYLMSWGINVAKNAKFLRDIIRQVTRYTYTTIDIKSRSKVARANGGTCNLQKGSVIWLGTHAFYTILSKKHEVYGTSTLLRSLQFELSLSCNKRLKHRFKKVVKEGLGGVAALDF
ncbi:hypothetical protein K503DRAFT_696940, partial [Rhizopogon vinicolor AM-OR11-026]